MTIVATGEATMKLPRKTVVSVAASLMLAAGISALPVFGDCQAASTTGYCALSSTGDAVVGWEIGPYGVAAFTGPVQVTVDWK